MGVAVGLLAAPAVAGNPGTLDLTFGAAGYASTPLLVSVVLRASSSVVALPDGRLIAFVNTNNDNMPRLLLVRFLTDGRLDPSFGNGGFVTHSNLTQNVTDSVVGARQADGKLVVVAGGYNVNRVLLRFFEDGSLDTEFGSGGLVSTPLSGAQSSPVILLPDGKLVIAGDYVNPAAGGARDGFALARFLPTGAPDLGFGVGGVALSGATDVFHQTLTRQSDGKLIVGGSYSGSRDERLALARFNPDGSLDQSFGPDRTGILTASTVNGSDEDIAALAVQDDGRIVAVGTVGDFYSEVRSDWDWLVTRFTSDGQLDRSFSGDGKRVVRFSAFEDQTTNVFIEPSGMIVVAGSVCVAGSEGSCDDTAPAVVRLTASGALDAGFGSEGRVVLSPLSRGSEWFARQTDGRLVSASLEMGESQRLTLGRVSAGTLPDECVATAALDSRVTSYQDLTNTTVATQAVNDPVPNCGGGSRARSVWYRYTAPANGTLNVDTSGSNYATIVSAYAGDCGNLFHLSCRAAVNGDSFSVPVSAGSSYVFMISSSGAAGGQLRFSLNFLPAVSPTPTPTRTGTPTLTLTPSPTRSATRTATPCVEVPTCAAGQRRLCDAAGCPCSCVACGEAWQFVGPPGGRVRALGAAPSDPNVIYAGSDAGVASRSSDGGRTWHRVGRHPEWYEFRTFDLAVDPQDPLRVYKATFSGGLSFSGDGGASWQRAPVDGYAVEVSPSNPSVVYLAEDGVWRSTDRGASWAPASTGLPSATVWDVVVDPSNENVAYAASSLVYKTTDGGSSWSPAGNVRSPLCLLVHPSTPGTLWVGTNQGVFMSTDGGGSWSPSSNGLGGSRAVVSLAIDPSQPTRLYAAREGGQVFLSTDGGASWNDWSSGITGFRADDLGDHYLAAGPGMVYLATAAGVLSRAVADNAWSESNVGLYHRQDIQVLSDPASPRTLYARNAGTWPAAAPGPTNFLKSVDGGATWSPANSGMPTTVDDVEIDPAAPTTLFAAALGSVYKSTDAASTWTRLASAIAVDDVAVAPSDSTILYGLQGRRLARRSTDGGLSWQTPTLSGFPTNGGGFAIDPFDPKTLYADGYNGDARSLYKSTDGGDNWLAVSASAGSVLVHPTLPGILFDAIPGSVRRSTDGGATWVAINNGLPLQADSFLQLLSFDRQLPPRLFAVLDRVLYASSDVGDSWVAVPGGQLPGEVVSVAFNPIAPNAIYVGSYRDGVLSYVPCAASTPVATPTPIRTATATPSPSANPTRTRPPSPTPLQPDAYEPDNERALAKPLACDDIQQRTFTASDVDWLTFSVPSNSGIFLRFSGAGVVSLQLTNPDGTELPGAFSGFVNRTCGVDPLPPGAYFVSLTPAIAAVGSYRVDLECTACDPTLTPTQAAVATATRTTTRTLTATPTQTRSPSATNTGTLMPTTSPTSPPTLTPTTLPTSTHTLTLTPTMSPTVTLTPTMSPTSTLTPTAVPSSTYTLTLTPTMSPTSTLTPTLTPSFTLIPTPTATPTVTRTPAPSLTATATRTPRPALDLEILADLGRPGGVALVRAYLRAMSMPVVAAQNDLNVQAPLRFAVRPNGRPDCHVNPDIDKAQSSFAFTPVGCTPGVDCAVRALIVSVDNLDPIADDSLLYDCKVVIDVGVAPGLYPIECRGPVASDPLAVRYEQVLCNDQLLEVQRACAGDCDGDGEVTVNELVLGVSIALGSRSVGDCPSFDLDGSSDVTVDEIVQGVTRALTGCS